MNRAEFQQISDIRFREARSLMDAGFSDGAYYLAGYAVECALKACIARRTQQYDFPDKRLAVESHTHNLTELLRLADLVAALQSAAQSDTRLQRQWITVREWSEAGRYLRWNAADAAELIEAIENPSGGLLPWIRQHW
jgi:HEPN domain-containing protein